MTEQLVFDARTQSAKDWALWLYIGHGLSLVFSLGLLSWLPLIINYLKRDDAADTFVYSHHRWQIRSFVVVPAVGRSRFRGLDHHHRHSAGGLDLEPGVDLEGVVVHESRARSI